MRGTYRKRTLSAAFASAIVVTLRGHVNKRAAKKTGVIISIVPVSVSGVSVSLQTRSGRVTELIVQVIAHRP